MDTTTATKTRCTIDITVAITRVRNADGSNDMTAACECGWVGHTYTSTATIHLNHLADYEASRHLQSAHHGLVGCRSTKTVEQAA